MYFPTKYPLFSLLFRQKGLSRRSPRQDGTRPKFPGFRQTVKSPKIFSYITDRIITLYGHTWTDKKCIFNPLFRYAPTLQVKTSIFQDDDPRLMQTRLWLQGYHRPPTLQVRYPLFRSNTHSSGPIPTLQPNTTHSSGPILTLQTHSSAPTDFVMEFLTHSSGIIHANSQVPTSLTHSSGCDGPEEWVRDFEKFVGPEEWVRT